MKFWKYLFEFSLCFAGVVSDCSIQISFRQQRSLCINYHRALFAKVLKLSIFDCVQYCFIKSSKSLNADASQTCLPISTGKSLKDKINTLSVLFRKLSLIYMLYVISKFYHECMSFVKSFRIVFYLNRKYYEKLFRDKTISLKI